MELAGLNREQWPEFLDGQSLVPYYSEQKNPKHAAVEIINIEYWGTAYLEFTPLTQYPVQNEPNNSYKTIRIVSQDYGYLYSHWCTGETELYDTVVSYDPLQTYPEMGDSLTRNPMIRTTPSN